MTGRDLVLALAAAWTMPPSSPPDGLNQTLLAERWVAEHVARTGDRSVCPHRPADPAFEESWGLAPGILKGRPPPPRESPAAAELLALLATPAVRGALENLVVDVLERFTAQMKAEGHGEADAGRAAEEPGESVPGSWRESVLPIRPRVETTRAGP